jgi:ubiquinone/menaquinone biosynthesis C-methylase UbiE
MRSMSWTRQPKRRTVAAMSFSAPTSDLVRSQFGAVADAYATSTYHATGPDLAALVAAAALSGTEHVLDLGCGAGHVALAVAPHATHVTAVDVTPDMVGTARRLATARGVANITFRVADAADLPFSDASFDLVTSRVAAHHFADPRTAMAEAVRVLRPGGRLLLIDSVAPEDAGLDTFVNCVELLRDASHVRDWRPSEWLTMLALAGFHQPVVLDQFGLTLDGQDWVQRMRTPPARVATIRQLLADATPAQRQAFHLRSEDPWGFTLGLAFFQATRPA